MLETSTQGALSTPSGESPKGGFSWSASRHDSFATCKRRYYYSYYAAAERSGDPAAEEAVGAPALGGERRARHDRGVPARERPAALARGPGGAHPLGRALGDARRAGARARPSSRSRKPRSRRPRRPKRPPKRPASLPAVRARVRNPDRAGGQAPRGQHRDALAQELLQERHAAARARGRPRALARARGPRLVPRRRRRGVPAHGPRLSATTTAAS